MPATVFADLLVALSLPAADALVAELSGGSWRSQDLSAARCACRALRDLVDQSLLGLSLKVKPDHLAPWRAGRLPPPLLARWPRANNIVLDFDDLDDAADADAMLLAAPLLQGARQRVTQLTLHLDDPQGDAKQRGGEVAVAALAPRLPALRSLSLTGHGMPAAMSYDPVHQAAMFDALAALPCLGSLTLPGCRSLDCAGALAGSSSLRSLTLDDSSYWDRWEGGTPDPLTQQALANISSLQRLQRLTLLCCGLRWRSSADAPDSGGLLALPASLPLTVEELEVGAQMDSGNQGDEVRELNVAISLRQGSIQSLRLEGNDLFLENVSLLAGALLSCPTLGRLLEQLELASPLMVRHEEELQHMLPLLQLLGRCQQVKLRTLQLYPGLSVEAALEVLRQLPQAEELELRVRCGGVLRVRLHPPSPGPASASTAAGGSSTGSATAVGGQPSSEDSSRNCNPGGPTPVELLRVTVQRWAESGWAIAHGIWDAGVLLRGPTVAGLVGSPEGLAAWVRQLAERAGVAAGGPLDLRCPSVWSFKAVPPAATVLLYCNANDTASAVAAAAKAAEREAVVAAAKVMPAGGAVSAAATVETAAGSEADAAAVVSKWGRYSLEHWASEVAQEVLEGGHGAGAWGEPERLECVLQVGAELNGLPEEVRL